MNDPLSQVIALLQPRTVLSKRISGAGRWGVRYSEFGHPSFCAELEGRCRLAVDGHGPMTLEAGDFVLLPATPGFTMSGFEPVKPERIDPKVRPHRRVKSATARAVDARTYGCSAAGSSSIRRIRRCWCRCCRRWCTCAAPSGSRCWCGSSARKRANGGQAATSCSRASWRCCSSKRCGRRRAKMPHRGYSAGWPMRN